MESSDFYAFNRPENRRYRTRIQNPPFSLTVPFGWPVHHKWPLSLGGPGDQQQAEGQYTPEGEILHAPNLVVLEPSIHTIWHQVLARQPFGPRPGQGPSESTPIGQRFCVLDLIS
jgi:hypothetical protein